jgi:hypothetical protein
MYVICIAVEHYGKCEETIQCNYSNKTECRDSKCQCRDNLEYKGYLCVERLGMYIDHTSYDEVVVVVVIHMGTSVNRLDRCTFWYTLILQRCSLWNITWTVVALMWSKVIVTSWVAGVFVTPARVRRTANNALVFVQFETLIQKYSLDKFSYSLSICAMWKSSTHSLCTMVQLSIRQT